MRILLGLVFCMLSNAALAEMQVVQFVAVSDSGFAHPHDLTLSPDRRYLFVADMNNDAVQVLDPDTLHPLAMFGVGELSRPHDVAFDRQGRLLVADTGNNRVAIYRVDGLDASFSHALEEGLRAPEGVAVAGDGRVYVTNARGDDIVVFQDAKRVLTVGASGSDPGEYRRPHDIGVDARGTVYVADPGNDRVQILDSELGFITSLGGEAPYDFDEPKYFFVDESGRLYVGDQHNDQVKIYNEQRELVGVIGTGERGDAPGQLDRPEGVEVHGNRVWVSDTYNNRIVLYRLEPAS